MRNLLSLVTCLQLFIHFTNSQDHYNFDGGEDFCKFAPSKAELAVDKTFCEHCDVFVKPLLDIRGCCDVPAGPNRVGCLDKLRLKEMEVVELFLNWKEPESRETLYRKHLAKCADRYESVFRDIGCANDDSSDFCLDSVGWYRKHCSNKDSEDCVEKFPREVKNHAFDAICVNDKQLDYNMHAVASETYSAVHVRCFRQQALTKKFRSINDLVHQFNVHCLAKRYGVNIDWDTYRQMSLYKSMGLMSMWPQLSRNFRGIFDDIDTNADTYLDTVCDFQHPNELAKSCIETPITESFLTYESTDHFNREIKSCCKGVPLSQPMSSSTRDKLRKCLQSKHMYEQFYPLGGLYTRGLMRENFGVMWECESEAMAKKGYQPGYLTLTQSEREAKYTNFGYPAIIEEKMKMTRTMTPENYFFLLRGYGNHTDDPNGYFKSACEACVMGERLGHQAYVFPGIACPALVANALYKPIQFESKCPDQLFYKFQVANYCCLHSAVHKYNLGSDYDPEVCPDLSDVFVKSTP